MNNHEPQLIRSRRRTISMEIRDGEVIVRAPLRASNREIQKFIDEHEAWVRKHLNKAAERQERLALIEPLTAEELADIMRRAKAVIPERVAFYAEQIGVDYGRVTIRHQKTRWGSCSAKGNLNFNCLLLLAPPEVLDSVVVHELCHRRHMNHSKQFYALVEAAFPDYRRWNKWLKEHGDELQKRAP